MKPNGTYRFIALLMACLTLITSTGFAADMHYCQGELKHFSLFGEAKSCHEINANKHCKSTTKTTCHSTPKENAQAPSCQKDCCNNEAAFLSLDTDVVDVSVDKTEPISTQWMAVISTPQFTLPPMFYYSFKHHQNYKSPLLKRDIPLLVQSFLL